MDTFKVCKSHNQYPDCNSLKDLNFHQSRRSNLPPHRNVPLEEYTDHFHMSILDQYMYKHHWKQLMPIYNDNRNLNLRRNHLIHHPHYNQILGHIFVSMECIFQFLNIGIYYLDIRISLHKKSRCFMDRNKLLIGSFHHSHHHSRVFHHIASPLQYISHLYMSTKYLFLHHIYTLTYSYTHPLSKYSTYRGLHLHHLNYHSLSSHHINFSLEYNSNRHSHI